MKTQFLLLPIILILSFSTGCTSMTQAQLEKRDYENAVAYEARVGYKWTAIYIENDRKYRLKEYDLSTAINDLTVAIGKVSGADERAAMTKKLDALYAARKEVLSKIEANRKLLEPALALQSSESYAAYRRTYALQQALSERDRIENGKPESAGATYPGIKAYNP